MVLAIREEFQLSAGAVYISLRNYQSTTKNADMKLTYLRPKQNDTCQEHLLVARNFVLLLIITIATQIQTQL